MRTFWKIALYILIFLVVLLVGLCGAVIVAWSGNGEFYVPAIFIGSVAVLTSVFLSLFKCMKFSTMKRVRLIFLSVSIVSCAVYEGLKAYDRSVLCVGTQDVDLNLYAPFAENTLAASLDTPSTLRLEADLPRLDGATALYPVYAAFSRAVYPEETCDPNNPDGKVTCNNTVHAYENLIDKSADIIFTAAPSEQQSDAAAAAGVSFRYTPIGSEAFVFFVNARNPVDGLTVERLQAVYSGDIVNWMELGGYRKRIRAFQRNEDSGSQTAFIRFMEGRTIIEPPREDVVYGMGGIVSRTADYANRGNAIGFSFRFYLNERSGTKT